MNTQAGLVNHRLLGFSYKETYECFKMRMVLIDQPVSMIHMEVAVNFKIPFPPVKVPGGSFTLLGFFVGEGCGYLSSK
jgi:hypothetical protein